MRLFILAFILVSCICSCSDKNVIPPKVLPPDTMEVVLWDMIQAEKFATSYLKKDTTKNIKIETLKLYEDVFQIHKITRQKFIESYKFYLSRPDIARAMLDSLGVMADHKRADAYKVQQRKDVKLKNPE